MLIGATTENPSFEIISALLSRARVYALKPLDGRADRHAAARARWRMKSAGWASEAAGFRRSAAADRRLLQRRCAHRLQHAGSGRLAAGARAARRAGAEITDAVVEDALQSEMLLYDKAGEEHYNLISALHKSVRNSDPDAALYWLGRMLEAGEDPLYIARRVVRMAVEDIGLADPQRAVAVHGGARCGGLHRHAGREPRAGRGGGVPLGRAQIECAVHRVRRRCSRTWSEPPPNRSRCTCATRPLV